MADGRNIENRFSAIYQRHVVQLTRNLECAELHADARHVTRIANFENLRRCTAAVLKMFFFQ